MTDKAIHAGSEGAAVQQSRAFQRFVAGITLAGALLLPACGKPPPEQAVRGRLQALQQAIDARDAAAVDDLLAADFIGNDGMDHRQARQLAAGLFLRYRSVGAKFGPIEVELRGHDAAVARFNALATGGGDGLLPEHGQAFRVETGWQRTDGQWMLRNARWTPVL